jgi:hypothetical protein
MVTDFITDFTCRSRTLKLPPAEAALALNQQIEPQLRARSPIYYWRHGQPAQERSRREAVCTKKGGWHLRSFGSHDWWAQAAREQCDAARWRDLDSCKAFSLQDLPEDWRRANGVNSSSRGAGWWRWKPFYLLRELRTLAQGDVLVHADYDLVLAKRPHALWCLGQSAARGIAAFHMPCLTDRAWCKREVASALNATDAMLDTTQVRPTPTATSFFCRQLAAAARALPVATHAARRRSSPPPICTPQPLPAFTRCPRNPL